jgi:hypothetical protein
MEEEKGTRKIQFQRKNVHWAHSLILTNTLISVEPVPYNLVVNTSTKGTMFGPLGIKVYM